MEAKNTKNNVGKICKNILKKIGSCLSSCGEKLKTFSKKDFGKFKGAHVLVVVCVILIILCFSCCNGDDEIAYPVVYKVKNGDTMLLTEKGKEDDAVLLARDSSAFIKYANTSNRFAIYNKTTDLYLYDAKNKSEDYKKKILSRVSKAYFTPNDEYIVAFDVEGTLYSIIPGKNKENDKLETGISDIVGLTDSKVVYKKDNKLYIRGLKSKKDDKQKIGESIVSASFKDDKYVVYSTRASGESEITLYVYNVKKNKSTKIASNISMFQCATESCESFIYLVKGEGYDVYYYSNSKSEKLIKGAANLKAYDVDRLLFIYTDTNGQNNFKNGKKDPYKMDDEVKSVQMLDDSFVYYFNDESELFISKINGNKLSKAKKIADNVVWNSVRAVDGKIVFVANADDNENGDLYIANTSRVKKIDNDVRSSSLKSTENNDRVYYLKDYGSNSGSLYYTKGGKSKFVDDDVYSSYVIIKSDLVYYIRDYSAASGYGDLYRYNGSTKRITDSVSSFLEKSLEGFN